MKKLLINMTDGGLASYDDDSYSYPGCPTCNWGSSYITEIDVTLTKYAIHVETSKMYDYVISEGDMMKIFLSCYDEIQSMTEKEFTDWFKKKLLEVAFEEEIQVYRVSEIGDK